MIDIAQPPMTSAALLTCASPCLTERDREQNHYHAMHTPHRFFERGAVRAESGKVLGYELYYQCERCGAVRVWGNEEG